MNILRIMLHTPSTKDIAVAALMIGLVIVVTRQLVLSGLISPWLATALLVGVAGAELASACGVSVKEHGLRGLALVSFSSGLVAVVVVTIANLADSVPQFLG